MPSSPASDGWRVEKPRPADRGLVARLLEQVLAVEPSVAPEVAAGSVRPGPWLQRVRPAWSGVVVDAAVTPRSVVGYAAVVTDPSLGHVLQDLLVAPGHADRGVEAVLRAAAAEAVRELADAPAPDAIVDLEIAPVTYPDARVERPRRRLAIVGAAVIVAVGTLGVLAVQVGAGPLGGVLPFLDPSGVSRAADGPSPQQPTATPAAPASPQPVAPAGQPLQPLPSAEPTTTPSGSPTGAPDPSASPTGTPSQPAAAPGPASSLLDPVVETVVDTVDGLTGGALSPVTGMVEQAGDGLTDTLDDLLPAPRD